MTEPKKPETINPVYTETAKMSLVERLERCRSRKAARETIADFCEERGIDTATFKLSVEEQTIFASLK